MISLFKKIIREFHERGIPEVKKRDISIPLNSKKVVSVIGARRSGKTYVLYQLIKEVDDIKNVVYINFEDERFNIRKENLHKIIDAYYELYPGRNKPYFFFDEIQNIDGWEKFVRRIYDTISKRIFITGSSAKLLSREIATSLRGRTITYEVYPLSFKEFLMFKGIRWDRNITTIENAKIKHEFKNYLDIGGYPETVFFNDDIRERTIRDYSSVMLLRDVIERYQLRNPLAVSSFFDRCIANYAKELSINKLYNEMKSFGVNVSRESIYEYVKYFEEAFIALPAVNYSKNIAKKEIKKIYLIDHAIANLRFSENLGRNLENVAFIELKRRGDVVHYYKKRRECDFVVKNKVAIQSCYELNNKREILGLKEAMKNLNIKKGIIITYEEEGRINGVDIIPAWKWLLEDYSS